MTDKFTKNQTVIDAEWLNKIDHAVDESLKLPEGDTANTVFPDIATRSNKFAAFDFEGGAIALTSSSIDPNALQKSGDTATGQIRGIPPIADEDFTRKDYVDAKLPLDGSLPMTNSLTIDRSAQTNDNTADMAFISQDNIDVSLEWINIFAYDHLNIKMGKMFIGRERTGFQINDETGDSLVTFYINPDGNVSTVIGNPNLFIPPTPIDDEHLTPKLYVDLALAGKVSSDTAETGTDKIVNMVSLTQAAYDALTPVSTTFYVIVG